jgi:hypothetical protein
MWSASIFAAVGFGLCAEFVLRFSSFFRRLQRRPVQSQSSVFDPIFLASPDSHALIRSPTQVHAPGVSFSLCPLGLGPSAQVLAVSSRLAATEIFSCRSSASFRARFLLVVWLRFIHRIEFSRRERCAP